VVLDDMMNLRIEIHKTLNPKEALEMRKKKRKLMREKTLFEQTGFQLSLLTKADIRKIIE